MTHVSTSIFQGLFKNIVFRSVALVIKSSGLFLIFFTHSRLFTGLYPTLCVQKKIIKKILQITNYEKSKNFTVIVSKMSARAKKTRGGAPNAPPPPGLDRVKKI